MKNARQAEILNIIQNADVETQEQLLLHLKERGFNTTQATISRDIKELRLVKELTGNGGYRYAANGNRNNTGAEVRLRNIFKEVAEDMGKPVPLSGNLDRWAEQGVLMLNSVLTLSSTII